MSDDYTEIRNVTFRPEAIASLSLREVIEKEIVEAAKAMCLGNLGEQQAARDVMEAAVLRLMQMEYDA